MGTDADVCKVLCWPDVGENTSGTQDDNEEEKGPFNRFCLLGLIYLPRLYGADRFSVISHQLH